MELIKNLFGEKGYIDGITIIDTKGKYFLQLNLIVNLITIAKVMK